MTPFKLALLNLSRKKIPTAIAVLAIAISVACSGILLRLDLVSQNRFSKFGRGGDAIVGAKAGGIEIILGALNGEGDYPGYLPNKLFESLRSQETVRFEDGAASSSPYIRSVIPIVYFAKLKNFRVIGTDDSFFSRPESSDSIGFSAGHWSGAADDIVIGATVAAEENLKLGDTVTTQVWTSEPIAQNISFKVAGILLKTDSIWDRTLFASIPTAQKVLANANIASHSIWGSDVLNYFLIYLKPGGYAPLEALINRRTVGQSVLISSQTEKLKELSGVGTQLGLFFTALILLLSALSVMSMLVTRFDAMLLQLAVLRALGYKRKQICSWLLYEGFLLGVAAVIIGMILDALGFPIIRALLGSALPPPDLIGSSVFASAPVWLITILATTASVFIPLHYVYHQDVHFSLRN